MLHNTLSNLLSNLETNCLDLSFAKSNQSSLYLALDLSWRRPATQFKDTVSFLILVSWALQLEK